MKTEKKMEPELRFPGFEGDWKSVLLDKFANRASGHTPSKSYPEYYDGTIPWISLADSKRLDQGYITETKSTISQLGLNNSSAVLHPPETVLVSRDAGVGKSAVMKHSMAVSQHFIVWRPIEKTSDSWFLYYWLQIMKPHFERMAIGSTIKTIGLPYFKKLKIDTPTLPEQQKIADFLTAVDARISQLIQKKALLEDYKKGLMQQLFSQTLRFKDDHGNDFPEWEEKRLGEIVELTSGQHLGPNDYNNGGEGTPYFTGPSDFTNHEGGLTKWTSSPSKFAFAGSILITVKGNGVGTLMLLELEKVAIGRQLMALSSDEYDCRLLHQYLQTLTHYFWGLASGNLIPGLSRPDILGTKIPFPTLPEQHKIADCLSALDRRIESLATRISLTQEFKKGLLQKMFV